MQKKKEGKALPKQRKKASVYITQAAVIAALYAALTYLASVFGIAYGNVQFRFSEALTVLAVFTPAAVPGLTIGCFIGNLGSPFGIMDIILGTLATFLAAYFTYVTRKVGGKFGYILAPVFSTLFNAVIIGIEIAVFLPEGLTWAGFAISALQVGAGELAVCCVLGIPLRIIIEKTPGLKKLFKI
ncbi:MAG: QueT transporter family protein [Clostridia bacterium]|nr:QueT transporter family protein [Clostridia bacterium]MBR4049358.1 QueT transporter family protein [Clostridia bacterium]